MFLLIITALAVSPAQPMVQDVAFTGHPTQCSDDVRNGTRDVHCLHIVNRSSFYVSLGGSVAIPVLNGSPDSDGAAINPRLPDPSYLATVGIPTRNGPRSALPPGGEAWTRVGSLTGHMAGNAYSGSNANGFGSMPWMSENGVLWLLAPGSPSDFAYVGRFVGLNKLGEYYDTTRATLNIVTFTDSSLAR